MTQYIELFFIFCVIGWIIDTADRSWSEKKFVSGTYIPFFSPLYGFGSVALVLIFDYLPAPAILQIIFGAIAVTAIEFVSGLWCVYILKKRLWNYSASRFNILGHIDAEHSFYWLIVSLIFYLLKSYF